MGKLQFLLIQSQIFELLAIIKIRQAIYGFFLGTRQYTEELVFVSHLLIFPLAAHSKDVTLIPKQSLCITLFK